MPIGRFKLVIGGGLLAAALLSHAGQLFTLDTQALNETAPPPGTVIDAANVDQYAAILDASLVELIRDRQLTIATTATYSLPTHPAYVAATRQPAQLGERPGELFGYTGGRPFPSAPEAGDPRAGEKIAWNFRYAWSSDSGEIGDFIWHYRDMRSGRVERTLSFYASQLRFMHRHLEDPVPDLPNNPAGIYNGLYLRVLGPPDLRNTQLLIHRLEDDTVREQVWLYVASHRRVRRLASGQTTDAFLGSDIMIEDFIGYNGRISDMEWSYHGTVNVLLPFYKHDELQNYGDAAGNDGFQFAGFHGTGECFPDVPWQLRTAHIIEAKPVWDQHPLSKRRYYVDAETFTLAYGNLYDRAQRLWKIGYGAFSHPDHHLAENRGIAMPIIDVAVQVDVQAQHCTTVQFKALTSRPHVKASDFSVQALRVKGR